MSHYSHQFGQVAASQEILLFDDFEMDAIDLRLDDDEDLIVLPVDDSPLSLEPCHKSDLTFDVYGPVAAYVAGYGKPFHFNSLDDCLAGMREDYPSCVACFDDDCVRVWDYVDDGKGGEIRAVIATIVNNTNE